MFTFDEFCHNLDSNPDYCLISIYNLSRQLGKLPGQKWAVLDWTCVFVVVFFLLCVLLLMLSGCLDHVFYFRIATRTVKLKTRHSTLITQSDLPGVNRWTPTHTEWKPSSKKTSVKNLPVSITDVLATAPRVTFLLTDASPFCTAEFYLPMCAKNSRHTVSWEAEGAPLASYGE